MLGAAPFNWQLTDSYFRGGRTFITRFLGGMLFALFAGFYYWFPKATGRMLSETLGKWALLAAGDRIPHDLRSAALRRHSRNAAAHLHLRRGARLGESESARVDRPSSSRPRQPPGLIWNIIRSLRKGTPGGQRSLGRVDRLNGPPRRRRLNITSRFCPKCAAVVRCGT